MSDVKTKGTIALLAQLTKVVHKKTTEELLGMRWRNFLALSVLYDQPELSQQSLCEALVTDPNNCVLLLNELESQGWVERRRDPADRRRHIVELTDDGREAYRRSILAREAVEDDVLGALDEHERQSLRRLLSKALGYEPPAG